MSDHPHNTTFLSTLSLRRATLSYFYIIKVTGISIHALLAESDPWGAAPPSPTQGYFYPRSPCGERRCRQRAGKYRADFYPRSPCGERLGQSLTFGTSSIFLSTLSLRRATIVDTGVHVEIPFLSTLSLRRATQYCRVLCTCNAYFYPRSPCGERPCVMMAG